MPAHTIHHINAATMCPVGERLINGTGGLFSRGKMVCHCLLIESEVGLILVDTGIGTRDMADPDGRLGKQFRLMTNPLCDPAEAAISRVTALGFSPADVRHIVPTHLDLDHAGGLSDFENAEVHIHAPEHAAAMNPATRREKNRYRAVHWAHGPKWALHSAGGDDWFGFNCVQAIAGCPDVLLIPLEGHTRGHAGVAVRTQSGWLLHAGDAYFHHREMSFENPRCTPGLALFQRIVAMDDELRRANQVRLRHLTNDHPEVRIHCAHCPTEFDAFASAAKPESPGVPAGRGPTGAGAEIR